MFTYAVVGQIRYNIAKLRAKTNGGFFLGQRMFPINKINKLLQSGTTNIRCLRSSLHRVLHGYQSLLGRQLEKYEHRQIYEVHQSKVTSEVRDMKCDLRSKMMNLIPTTKGTHTNWI